jgi:hypothetical protein
MLRVCQACSSEFDAEYRGRGRPRAYCRGCQPPNTRMVGKTVNEQVNLRPALAWLKCLAERDEEGLEVLIKHGDPLEIIVGLSDLVLTFVQDVAPDNTADHINSMFKAYETAQRGNRG